MNTLDSLEDLESKDDNKLVIASKRREKRRLRLERAEWWSTKLHALLWVIGSILGFVLSNFLDVLRNHSAFGVNSFIFYLGSLLFVFESLAVFRMAFWFKPGETANDFEKAHPTFLLATTLGGVLCFFTLTLAFWPVYRIFSPFLLVLFWFGMIMSLHFIP